VTCVVLILKPEVEIVFSSSIIQKLL
jgi:hypothetical protein